MSGVESGRWSDHHTTGSVREQSWPKGQSANGWAQLAIIDPFDSAMKGGGGRFWSLMRCAWGKFVPDFFPLFLLELETEIFRGSSNSCAKIAGWLVLGAKSNSSRHAEK